MLLAGNNNRQITQINIKKLAPAVITLCMSGLQTYQAYSYNAEACIGLLWLNTTISPKAFRRQTNVIKPGH